MFYVERDFKVCKDRDFKVCKDLVPISKQDLGTNKGFHPALTASACPPAPLFPAIFYSKAWRGERMVHVILRWDGADQRASAGAA